MLKNVLDAIWRFVFAEVSSRTISAPAGALVFQPVSAKRVYLLGALFAGSFLNEAFTQCTPNEILNLNQTICTGGSLTLDGGDISGPPVYAWQVSANGGAWNAAAGVNNAADYVLPVAYTNTAGVYAFRRVVSRTIPDACSDTSSAVTITVVADLSAVAIGAAPAASVCVGSPMTLQISGTTGGSGNFLYDWEASPNGVDGWENAPGDQNGPSYVVATDIPGMYFFRQKMSDSGSGCDDNILSDPLMINVSGPSPVYSTTGGGNYCAGPGQSIFLSGSIAGETYELLVETNQFPGFSSSGISKVGTGGPLTFDLLRLGGDYRITAPREEDGCSATMNGTVTITPDFTLDAQAAPASAICGQEVTVVVRAVCTGAALIGMQFSVAWDSVSFEYVPGSAIVKTLPTPLVNNSSSGYLQYSWSALLTAQDVNASDTLLIFKLKAISEDGSEEIALVDYMPGDLEALQEHFHTVKIQTTPPASVDLAEPNGNLTAAAPLVCKGANNVALTFRATAGDPPFTLVINGATYNNMTDGSVITLTANANTTYNLTSVQDANGCVNQGSPALSSVSVQVNETPTVTIDPLGAYPIGTTLTHAASIVPAAPANGNYTYRWRACPNAVCNNCTPDDFLPNPAAASPMRQWLTVGVNSVRLRLITPGCPDVTDCEDLDIKLEVSAMITGEDTLCSGQSSILAFSGTPNAVVTYNINGGASQNLQLDGMGQATLNTGALTNNTSYVLTEISYAATPPVSLPLTDTLRIIVEPVPALNCTGLQSVQIPTNPGDCFATYTWKHPTYNTSNNCIITNIAYTAGLPVPALLPAGGVFSSGANAQENFAIGQTIVTYHATDLLGNNTSTCSITVTVTDQEAPVVFCPTPGISVNASLDSCSAVVNYQVTASDNCNFTLVKTSGLASGSNFPIGPSVVQYAAADSAGLVTTCSFTITVNDTQAPTITCPSNTTINNDAGLCSAVFVYGVPFSDNCPGATILKTQGPNSGAAFPIGSSVVAYRATDATGLTSVCSFTVQVNDTERPTINCPNPITVSNTIGLCTGVATYTVTASDNCGATATLLSGLASGATFPIGTTTNVFVATDAANNTATCSFTVRVNDNQAPTITCPANFSVSTIPGGCTAVVNYPGIGGGDNCPGFSIGQTQGLSSGDTFPLGATLNAYKGTDAAGNTQTCSFTVTVRDTTPPVFTACPVNATVNTDQGLCTAMTNYLVTATDNCSFTLTKTAGLASGSAFPTGANAVTWSVADTAGNTAICQFTVTVKDNQLPTITCPANISMFNDAGVCNAVVQYAGVTFSDNCTGATVQQTTGLPSNSLFPVGTTLNTYLVSDASGNTQSCAFTVTVTDNEKPLLVCPSDIQLNNELNKCSAVATYAVTAADNCDGALTPSLNTGLVSGSAFPVGVTTVAYSAVDVAGNSTGCSFTVTVSDIERPSINCPANLTVNTDDGVCTATVSYLGISGSDNCPGFHIGQTQGLFSGASYPLGVTLNQYQITDAAGNTRTCSFTVTVQDVTLPVFTACPVNATVNTDQGVCGATVSYTVTASDNCAFTLTRTAGPAGGTIFPVGTTQVSWLVADTAGNSAACSFSVLVTDNELPVITCPADISVVNTPGACSATVSFTGAVFTDNCTVSLSQTTGLPSGAAFPVGNTVITYQAADASGNQRSCSFNIRVTDNELPTISCPQNVTINTELGLCSAAHVFTATATDNCPGVNWSQTAGLSSGAQFPIGTSTVELTALDASGNTARCSFSVTVRDPELPAIMCPAAITLDVALGECSAVVSYPGVQATDNCPGVAVAQTDGLLNGGIYPVGVTTNAFQATDAAGNTRTCTFTVTVRDTQFPTFTACPPSATLVNDPDLCGAVVNYTVSATDNCALTVTQTAGLASGATFPIGSTTIKHTATDASGNSTDCVFVVTVNDTQFPKITCPEDIFIPAEQGQCSAVVQFSTASATDNCPNPAVNQTAGPVNGATFPVGPTQVVYTAADASGNASSCSFTVLVFDSEAPAIVCPQNVTLNNDLGLCSAVHTYTVTVSDNCPGATYIQNAGLVSAAAFPMGATVNSFVAADPAGNTAFCSFTVTVRDAELPSVNCPGNIERSTDPDVCGAVVNFPGVQFDDNCPGEVSTQTAGLASGALFPVGLTTNTYRVSDAAGNSVTCSFTVRVTDNQFPVFTTCPPSATRSTDPGLCVAVVNYAVTATDNCAHTVTQTAGLPSGASFPIGATTSSYTVVDASGNTATCAFTITVGDTQFPAISCPQDITVVAEQSQCSAAVQFNGASATDNCPNLTVNQTAGPVSGAVFPVGPTQVAYTATDASGNSSTCSFTVTVRDLQAPVATCPADITLNNDNGQCAAVHTYMVTASDNCPGATYTQTAGIASGGTFPVGTTVNGFVAADQAGNTAFCSFTVTVRDAELPSVTCPGNIERNTDPDVCGAVVTFPGVQFDDNCPGEIITQTGGFFSGALFPVGLTTNTYRVSDAAGNSATCSFTVRVTDNQFPTVNCPANIAQGTDMGVCSATVFYMVTSTDNCAQTLTQSAGLPAGALFPLGQTTNEFLVTDASGNTKSCSFTVTVSDLEAPALVCPSDVSVNACDLSALPQISDLPFSGTSQLISSTAFGAEGGQAGDNCGQIASIRYADVLNGVCPAVVTRTFTVTDLASNSTVCVQTLTVDDVTAPTIACPETLIICADPATNKAFIEEIGPLSNGDNCDFTITYTITGNTSGAGNDDASGNTFNAGQSLVTYFATDACGNVGACSFEVRVRRTPRPRFLPATENICNGQSIDLAAFVDDQYNAAKRYDFYLGDPLNNGEFLGSVSATNGNPDPGQSLLVSPAGNNNGPTVYEYYVVGANTFNNGPNCLNVGGPFIVQVDPLPVGVGTPNLMTCSDVPLNIDLGTMIVNGATNVSFRWVAANNPRITGESLTPKTGAILNDILTNVWVLDTSVFYTVTPTGPDGCEGPAFTVKVLVKREPEGKASPTTQTICSGTPITPIQLVAGNGVPGIAYAWTRNNLNNVTGMPASGTDAPITGTPVNVTNQNRTTTLSIIPTGGNGCVGDPFTISITVRPEPVALATPISQTVCSGAPITPITIGYVNSVASSTFSWTRSNTGNVTGLPNAGTTAPISGNPVSVSGLPDTTVFTVTPVSGAGCVGQPVTATVRIKNSPVGGNDQSTACNGQAVNYDLQQNVNTLGNGVNADFSWVAVSNNPNVNGESLTPAAGDLITDVLTLTGPGPETVTYAVTPNGGNCPGATFFVTIVLTLNDVVAPTIACPADLSIEGCSPTDLSGPGYSAGLAPISVADFTALNGQVGDNCGLQTGMNYRDAAAGQCPITVSRTFVVSDLAGNTASCIQRIFIQDKTQPALLEPADITVSCETDLADLTLVGAPLATDNCGAVTVQYADDRSGLTGCSGTGTITRTWTATDACQNTTAAVQLITLTDLTPPVFNPTCQFQPLNILTSAGYDCPADAAISLKAGDLLSVSSTWTVGGYSVPALAGCIQDNCSAQQAIVIEVLAVEVEDALPCSRTIRVRFEIRDACGNAQPQPFVCIYNILDDEAPLFAPPADLTLDCAQDPNNLQLTGNVAQAFDDCGGTPSIQFTDDRTDLNGCNGTGLLRRTWTAADACNNLASAVQVITIEDKKAPVFANVPTNITVECGEVPPAGMPSATDNCDLQPIVTYNGETRANGNCADQYVLTRSWTAGDACGNTTTVSQTIVVRDTKAPIFGNMPPNLTVECDEIPPVGMPIALDQCDLQPEVFYAGETRFNGQCDNEFILRRTWTAFDNCGNAATSTQTLVVRDTRPPVFTSVPADQTVSCDAVPTPGVPVAADLCDQQVAIDYLGQTRTDGQCPDSYTLTRRWIAVDNCGNTATAIQIIAVRDQQAPTFTFVPANTTAECNAIPAPGTPAATDNCDQQVAVSYLGQTRTDGACADQYTITRSWVAADHCGNTAVATQQIAVSDTQAPVFVSIPANITVECDAIPDPGTPTAADNCDQQVAIVYTGQTRIDGQCPDSYGLVRSWTATDNCGNTASASQLVTVRDTKPPVFTSVPPAVTVACDSVPAPGTPTATDNCDQQVQTDYIGQTHQNGNCPGWYTLTRSWVAADNCGNTATATQVIQVRDIQSPVFTFVPPAVTVNCDAIPAPGTPVAVDNCDQQPVISFNGETRTDGQCPNAYTLLRSWIAADHCGNSTIATQLIAVQDTTPPTFTAPADVTVYVRANCGYDANLQVTGDVTNESDNCSANLQAVFTADTLPVNTGKTKWVVRRHWKLTDACGNMSAVQVQRIFVQDTIPPAIVCPPNITLQANQTCTAVLGSFPYSATDNCPEILTSYLRSGATAGNGVGVPVGLSFNAGLTTVTLVATDGVGNTAACSFTVQVVNCAITLGGQITFEHNNAPVPNATVNVTGDFNGFSITNTNGNFNVSILSGSNFVVRPTKPINPLNGVTTADGLAIFQHASGGAQLPAPFKRIAADVQKDNDIDAADANVIFQALQGNSAALQTLASSWRFIPKSHVFPNPNIPWGFPEHIALNGVSGPVTNLNFTGVKLGDVTGDANPALRPGPPVVFYAQDRLLQSGSEITVEIRVKDFEQLAAWQTAFGFNPEVIAFAGLEFPSAGPATLSEAANFGLYNVAKGEIRALWYQLAAASLADDTPLFRVRFQVLQSGQMLSEVLQLKPEALESLCFDAGLAQGSLELQFAAVTTSLEEVQAPGMELLQNRPNPFVDKTSIGFTLPASCDATLRILSMDGRELWRYSGFFPAGYSEVDFLLHDRQYAGVLYYELITPFGKRAKRMIAGKN